MYLSDDARSDLERLDGGGLGNQRNRALHSHRVTRRLVGVWRETCKTNEPVRHFNRFKLQRVPEAGPVGVA